LARFSRSERTCASIRASREVAVDPRRFSRLLFSCVAWPTAALAILAGLLALEVTHLVSLSRADDHSSRVIGDAHAVDRQMMGLEASVRGYLLSGQDEFLESWNEAKRGIGPALETLAEDVKGDRVEAPRVVKLRSGVTAWMHDAQQVVDERDRGGAAMERRRGAMDDLEGQIATIIQSERSLRALREQGAENSASLALGGSLVGTLLLGVAIGLLSRRHLLGLADLYESAISTRELVLRSAGEGIYGVDTAGHVMFMNPAGAALLGWDPTEVLGRDAHALFHHSTPDGHPYPTEKCPIYEAFRDGTVHHVDDEVFWRKDGTAFPVCYVSTPIRSPGAFEGVLEGAVVSFHDVAAERGRQAERAMLLEQACEGLRARDHVLSVAAHELRTPLTSLKMHADLLSKLGRQEDGDVSRPEIRRRADACTRAVDRMESIVGELLDAEQVHAHKVDVHRQRVVMAPLVRRCVEGLAPQADAAGCKVTLAVDERVVGEWDPAKLERIVTNLVTNAFVHGKGAPIEVSVHDGGARAVLEVRDYGAGIADADRDRIFRPLEHVDLAHHVRGLGLGLYVARGLAQAMGGDVVLATTEGAGATFRLELPGGEPPHH
jgi:PAS domain S-box-containing protein